MTTVDIISLALALFFFVGAGGLFLYDIAWDKGWDSCNKVAQRHQVELRRQLVDQRTQAGQNYLRDINEKERIIDDLRLQIREMGDTVLARDKQINTDQLLIHQVYEILQEGWAER